jgi:hypothetical protein
MAGNINWRIFQAFKELIQSAIGGNFSGLCISKIALIKMKTTDDNTDLSFQMSGRTDDFRKSNLGEEFGNRDSEVGENQNYSGSADGENTFTSLGGWDYYDLDED